MHTFFRLPAACLLTACLCLPVPAFAAQSIKLAVAVPTSGDFTAYGQPAVNAAKAVAADINAAGGIMGMQVEVVALDDQCKPELAINAANRAVSDKVQAVIGHICSGATKAALPIYMEAKLPVVSSASTSPDLTRSGDYPNFFRTIAPGDDQSRAGVELAVNKLGLTKIAVINDKGDYGKSYADFAKEFVEQSGKAQVVLFEGITVGAVDYSAIIQKIRASGAQGVIFGGYHPEASKLVQQMRKKRLNIPFIGPDSIMSPEFIELAGKDIAGVYATSGKDLSALPAYQKAAAQHHKLYGEKIGLFYMEAYAGAQALLHAMRASASLDGTKIMHALRTEYVDTPLGRIKFDAKGDAEGVGYGIYTVKDGKYIPLPD